jgi:hypothetical protein
VAFGLLGTFVLAIRQRIYFPLSLCATHFLITILLPIFIGAHFRTDLYIIPFLNMGLAYIVVLSLLEVLNFKGSRRISVMAIAGVVIITLTSHYLWQQASKIGPSDIMRHQYPEFWEEYYKGQGELRQVAKEIDQILPESAVVFTWGYGMQFFLRNYGVIDVRKKSMPPIFTLISRFDNGTLSQLIKKRDLSVETGFSIYILVDHVKDRVDMETLEIGIVNVFGPLGFRKAKNASLNLQKRWQLNSFWPSDVAVYRVDLK